MIAYIKWKQKNICYDLRGTLHKISLVSKALVREFIEFAFSEMPVMQHNDYFIIA